MRKLILAIACALLAPSSPSHADIQYGASITEVLRHIPDFQWQHGFQMYCETHNTSSTDYITVEMMSAQCVGYVREPSVQTWTQVWTPSPAEGTKVLGPGLWIATQSKSNWYCFDQEADGIYVKIYRKHYKYQAGTHTKILLYEGDYITEMWPICYEK